MNTDHSHLRLTAVLFPLDAFEWRNCIAIAVSVRYRRYSTVWSLTLAPLPVVLRIFWWWTRVRWRGHPMVFWLRFHAYSTTFFYNLEVSRKERRSGYGAYDVRAAEAIWAPPSLASPVHLSSRDVDHA